MRTLVVLGTILNRQSAAIIFASLLELAGDSPVQISIVSDARTGLRLAGLAHVDNRHFNLIIWDITATSSAEFKGANILAMPLDFNPKCKIIAITKPEDEDGRRIAMEKGARLALGRIPTKDELNQ